MKTQKGFTLIELLVVVAIIGLLSSVVLSSLNSARAKARDAQRLSDIRQIQTALELYYNDNGKYPFNAGGGSLSALNVLVPKYIAKISNDPLNTGTTPTWAWSNQKTYYYWGTGMLGACGPFPYTLWYRLEANSNGNAEYPQTPTPLGPNCVHLDNNSFTKHP